MIKYIKCYKRLVEHSASLIGEKGLLKIFGFFGGFFKVLTRDLGKPHTSTSTSTLRLKCSSSGS